MQLSPIIDQVVLSCISSDVRAPSMERKEMTCVFFEMVSHWFSLAILDFLVEILEIIVPLDKTKFPLDKMTFPTWQNIYVAARGLGPLWFRATVEYNVQCVVC